MLAASVLIIIIDEEGLGIMHHMEGRCGDIDHQMEIAGTDAA